MSPPLAFGRKAKFELRHYRAVALIDIGTIFGYHCLAVIRVSAAAALGAAVSADNGMIVYVLRRDR